MKIDDKALIRLAKKGDTSAFEQLLSHYGVYAYNLALRALSNPQEAEDVAQEAFIRVWKALPNFRGDAEFSTWLYRIVTNLCYNRLPKLKRELKALPADEGWDLPDSKQDVERTVISAELRQMILEAVDTLPDSQKYLIILRHLHGLRYDEIAKITDMPLGTVKTGIFRARKALKVKIDGISDDYSTI